MKKSLFIPLLLCYLAFAYIACDDYDDTYPNEYHKILSLKQTGDESVTLYTTGQDASFDVTIMKTGCDPSLTAKCMLTVLTEEELEEYNRYYTLLPPTAYSIEGGGIDFQSGELYKISKVTMKTKVIQALMEAPENLEKTFVLPISLVSVTDSVNSERDLYVMKPVITNPKVMFTGSENEFVKGFPSPTESVTFEVPVGLNVENLWNFTAKVELVNNDGKGGYMPSDYITLENDGVVTFEPNKKSVLKVMVSPGANGTLAGYVAGGKVALQITEIEGCDFAIDPTVFNLMLTGKEYQYNGQGVNTSMLSYNFANWGNGKSENLFDNNIETFANTPFPNRKLSQTGGIHPYLQLTLPEGVTDFAISFTQASDNAGKLRGFDVVWSLDGSFTDMPDAKISYSMKDLEEADVVYPIEGNQSFTTQACHSDKPVKYIRLVQTWNCEGNQYVTASERWHFRLAEFRLYGITVQ